jgi:ComF family protein
MWSHGLSEFARGVAQLVFPNSCLICDVPEEKTDRLRHGLCTDCHGAVTGDVRPACTRCGRTVGPHIETADGCVECRSVALGFDSVIRLGTYEGQLRTAAIRMKSAAGEALAEMMGRVFWESACERLRSANADVVVPVPLHWRREWGRGHNQSAALAEGIAGGLGVPMDRGCARRVRHTPQQVQPSAAARRENVRGAFRVRRRASVAGKRILLVDDVMTTGSTAGEVARTLKEAKAEAVVVAILARR